MLQVKRISREAISNAARFGRAADLKGEGLRFHHPHRQRDETPPQTAPIPGAALQCNKCFPKLIVAVFDVAQTGPPAAPIFLP